MTTGRINQVSIQSAHFRAQGRKVHAHTHTLYVCACARLLHTHFLCLCVYACVCVRVCLRQSARTSKRPHTLTSSLTPTHSLSLTHTHQVVAFFLHRSQKLALNRHTYGISLTFDTHVHFTTHVPSHVRTTQTSTTTLRTPYP